MLFNEDYIVRQTLGKLEKCRLKLNSDKIMVLDREDKMVRESNYWRTRCEHFYIIHRKANWVGHFLRRNCFLHDAIEGQITEVKGAGRRMMIWETEEDIGN